MREGVGKMSTMTKEQRLWFAGVLDATLSVKSVVTETRGKQFQTMQVKVGPVSESAINRMIDFLGNGWIQEGQYFELRGYAACRGLFQEVWGDICTDTRQAINKAIRVYKSKPTS